MCVDYDRHNSLINQGRSRQRLLLLFLQTRRIHRVLWKEWILMIKRIKRFIEEKKRVHYIKKYSYYRNPKYLNKYNNLVSKSKEVAL